MCFNIEYSCHTITNIKHGWQLSLQFKQSHTSRKNDVFIVLESETTLPLIIVVIIQNRRKMTPKKNLGSVSIFAFY